MNKVLKSFCLIVGSFLLANCATPYQEPAKDAKAATLTFDIPYRYQRYADIREVPHDINSSNAILYQRDNPSIRIPANQPFAMTVDITTNVDYLDLANIYSCNRSIHFTPQVNQHYRFVFDSNVYLDSNNNNRCYFILYQENAGKLRIVNYKTID